MNKFYLPDIQLYGLIKTILSADSVDQATIKVNGTSMSPFIKNGSVVSIKPFNKRQDIHLGDVVAMICPDTNSVLIHRVIKKRKKQLLLKGDNNIHNDGWYPKEDIVGTIDMVWGRGLIHKRCRFMNILIAVGSKTGLFNQLLFPFLRAAKSAVIYDKR